LGVCGRLRRPHTPNAGPYHGDSQWEKNHPLVGDEASSIARCGPGGFLLYC